MKEKKVPCSHSIFWAPSLSTKPMGSGMSYLNKPKKDRSDPTGSDMSYLNNFITTNGVRHELLDKPSQFCGSESEDDVGFDELG